MVTAWQQDRRRKQAGQLKSESVAGLEALLGGLSDIERQRIAEEERKRKAEAAAAEKARDEAEESRRSTESTARIEREKERTGILRQRAEAEGKAQETRAGALKAKQEADAQAAALDGLKRRARGGASEVELRRIAMNDPALGALDDDAVRAVMLEAQGEERKESEALAGAEAKRQATERSNRPKPQVLRPKRPMSDYERRMADARLRKAEADAKAAEAAAAGGGKPGGAKPAKPDLTAGEVEPIVELQGARNLLDNLAKMKTEGDIDTGPIVNAIDWFRSKAGVGDPKRVEFKAMVGTQIAEYIKSISGATVSEPERAALLQNVPTASDNDEAFMAKLATVKRMIDNKLSTKRRAFAATGRPTAIFDAQPGADDAAEADALFAD